MDLGKSSQNVKISSDTLCAYQLRIDSAHDLSSVLVIEKFLTDYNVQKWLFAHEIGKTTEKPHYQGIIYVKKELKDNDRNKIRYYFKTKFKVNTKQPVSITKAKNPVNLESYCLKDAREPFEEGNSYVYALSMLSSYSNKELDAIPLWKDASNFKSDLKKLIEENNKNWLDNLDFCKKIVDCYIMYDKSPPQKTMLFKYLLKSQRMSTHQYLTEIGMFGAFSNYETYEENPHHETHNTEWD
ncbi:MAG: replication protein [Cressdnaviricota sp.]|nr:MAG: replication protein [Cressdnaviricota sp.]